MYYLTKLSLLLVLLRLATSKRLRRTFWVSILILSLWTIAALIAQAVQCPPPQPWNILSQDCRNLVCGSTTLEWSSPLTPYTRAPSILHTTQSISSLTSLSFPSPSSFYGMFKSEEARNRPSMQSLRYGSCRSSYGRGEQLLLMQRSSVCITVAFEMASLKEYNQNADKSC